MPDGVFLDTVGLLALLNRDDDYHQRAAAVFREIGDQRRNVITTQLVLSELGNGLARSALRSDAAWLIQAIMADRAATIVYVDENIFREGISLYAERLDKTWGLVDCVSFAVMRRHGIQDAFTADRHFVQAGFTCLLTPPHPN